MSDDGGAVDSPASRYQRALVAARELAAAQSAVAEAGERRISAEVALDQRLSELRRISSFGPSTWWPRLRGQLADRQSPVAEAARQAEAEAIVASRTHRTAVERLLVVQAAADDLPAAREAAAASLPGASAELAGALLLEANGLAGALFTAQSARAMAARAGSELSSAARWSTYDTFLGGGVGATGMKHASIDAAGHASQDLVSLLAGLRTELQDLGAPTAYFGVQMDDRTASRDVWADNIFSDWEMHRRIGDSRERVQRLVVGLDELMVNLGERRAAAMARLDALIAASADR